VRLTRMLGIAVVAALAVTAFVGAGSASATTLCKTESENCTEANQYASGAAIVAESTEAVLTGSVAVQCASKIKITTNAKSGKPLTATVNELTWSGCKGGCSAATTTTLPTGSIEGTKGTNGKSGTITAKGAVVKLTGCFGFFTCTATAAEAKLAFNGGAIGTANAKAANVPVTISGFGCGTEGTWNAGGGSGGNPYVVKTVNGSAAGSIFSSFEP